MPSLFQCVPRVQVYYELPPSVFAVAENAYSSILRFRKPASVIISGESGAGKTETARQVLAYLARVSGAYLANVTSKMKAVPHGAAAAKKTRMQIAIDAAMRVKDRLVTSTLVTEALGNAKTTRNDNSSRFGKLMTVNFRGNGIAAGGSVQVRKPPSPATVPTARCVWQGGWCTPCVRTACCTRCRSTYWKRIAWCARRRATALTTPSTTCLLVRRPT
ncbi:hypothetical protein EON66_11870 [archaeon]|nr:MAG: hypothetical protein EON66_11870 [archaeon]